MYEEFQKGDRVEVSLNNNVDGKIKRYVGVIKAWAGLYGEKALLELNFYTDQYPERIVNLSDCEKTI